MHGPLAHLLAVRLGRAHLSGHAEPIEFVNTTYANARLFVNFLQPSFKLASKEREDARVIKRYHAPATPEARPLESPEISPEIKAHLKDIAEKLDLLRLLDEIRAIQHHLAAVAKGERMHTPVKRDPDRSEFLAGLTLAWKAGEVRPTHTTKPRPPRTWRSRSDPFEKRWPQISGWLEDEPDQTGVELFARLQQTHPGRFPKANYAHSSVGSPTGVSPPPTRLVFRDFHPH